MPSDKAENDLQSVCAEAYAQTRDISLFRDNAKLGFEIFLTPPRLRPPILFIGYNPGDASNNTPIDEARAKGYEDRPPAENELATAKKDYRLATQLQKMFEYDLLSECVALNAVFIRTRSIDDYLRLDADKREELQEFCFSMVRKLVDAMDPERIVVLGFRTLDLLQAEWTKDCTSPKKNRQLTRWTQVFKRQALAILHPSARISSDDLKLMADRVRFFTANGASLDAAAARE